MTSEEVLISPRIASLKRELKAGNATALDTFWQEVAVQGTPLVEPIEDDDKHMLVTFLWHAKEEIKNVVVLASVFGWDFPKNQMTRLLDSDLWYKTYRTKNDLRFTYQLSSNDSLVLSPDVKDMAERTATWQLDPLNRHPYPSDLPWASSATLPAAPSQPWVVARPGILAGKVQEHRLFSNILNNERNVWVYTPPSYTPGGEPYGLLILFDGDAYLHAIPTPTILDNLLAEGHIPPLMAVMLDNPNQETRDVELACYPPFVAFLTEELIPWLRQRYYVTSDPASTIVGGSSFGGLAAAFAGLCQPAVFGNILSQSGSFTWKPDWKNPTNKAEYEWLTRQFVLSPKLPLRFYLDCGQLEAGPTGPLRDAPSQVVVHRHLRDVLETKGYPVHYAEYPGGHDYICWQGTLADGLAVLIGKKRSENRR